MAVEMGRTGFRTEFSHLQKVGNVDKRYELDGILANLVSPFLAPADCCLATRVLSL